MMMTLTLPPAETRFRDLLAARAGHVVPWREVAESVWGRAVPKARVDSLLCRVRARERHPIRTVRGRGYVWEVEEDPSASSQPGTAVLGASWDRATRTVHVGSASVRLTASEALLLDALDQAGGQPVGRRELLARALGRTDDAPRRVDALVARLRGKLGPARDRIQTIEGRGYAWVPAVRPAALPPPAPVHVGHGEQTLLAAAARFESDFSRADLEAVLGGRVGAAWTELVEAGRVRRSEAGWRVVGRADVLEGLLRGEGLAAHTRWVEAHLDVPEEIRRLETAHRLRRMYAEAEAVADRTRSPALRARCLLLVGAVQILDGRIAVAWQTLQRASAFAPASDVLRLHLARAGAELGHLDEARALVPDLTGGEAAFVRAFIELQDGRRERCVEILEAHHEDPTIGARARATLALLRSDLDQGIRELEQAVEALAETDDLRSYARSIGNLGNLCMRSGDYARAARANAVAVQLTRQFGDRRLLTIFMGDKAGLSMEAGRPREAARAFRENAVRYREMGSIERAGLAMANEAVAWADAREDQEARVALRLAAAGLRGECVRSRRGNVLCALAELALDGPTPAVQARVAELGRRWPEEPGLRKLERCLDVALGQNERGAIGLASVWGRLARRARARAARA